MSVDCRTRWLGHAGFLIQGRLTVYVDPWNVPEGLPKADLILFTSGRERHCSADDVGKLATPQTIVAGPRDCVSRFRMNQLPMAPGETKDILGLRVEAAPAADRLAYVLHLPDGKIRHCGDPGPGGLSRA